MLQPSAVAAVDIDIQSDVVFLPADRAEKLDLYSPKEGAALPAVVFVHGGGWIKGDKAEKRSRSVVSELARQGFVCASINYYMTKTPQKSYLGNCLAGSPQNVHDVKSAVRFLRSKASELRIDPNKIALAGASAGAHLAILAGVTEGVEAFAPVKDGYGDTSSAVQALFGLYGVYDWKSFHKAAAEQHAKEAEQLSPASWVDAKDPPIYLIHGSRDPTVPANQSERFYQLLQSKGHKHAVLKVVKGAKHSFNLRPKQADLRPELVAFLRQHLK